MRESDILYSNGPFWVRRELFGSGRLNPKSEGFAVYRDGLTYATRVASIGWSGDEGLRRAKAECDKRAASIQGGLNRA